MLHVAQDSYHLYAKLVKSDNWQTTFSSFTQVKPAEMGVKAYMAYNHSKSLYADGQFIAAGEALASGLFPKHQESSGNVEWGPLPYDPVHDGEALAGTVAGMLFAINDAEVYDNLATCITDQDEITKNLTEAIDTLYGRTNSGVVDFVSQIADAMIDIEANVAGCKAYTQEQATVAVSKTTAVPTSDQILANLTENKKHVELHMAKMKMRDALHDYMEFGYSLGEIYVTLAATN